MTQKAKRLRKLVSLKGFPDQIRPTIECVCATEHIENGEERWQALKACLGPKLLALPGGENRSVDNLISAQALLTAERIVLIKREGKRVWSSEYYGRRLHDVAEDPSQYFSRLGKRLLDLDKERWGIIEATRSLEDHTGQRIPLHLVALELAKNDIDVCQNLLPQPPDVARRLDDAGITWRTGASRFKDMLQYFNHVDIVRFEKGCITVQPSRIVEIDRVELERPEKAVSLEEFAEELIRLYREYSARVYHSPYVPIKEKLMDAVCDSLKVGPDHFTRLLLALPSKVMGSQILLSPYRKRLPSRKVVQAGRQQYYFVSVYSESKETRGESE